VTRRAAALALAVGVAGCTAPSVPFALEVVLERDLDSGWRCETSSCAGVELGCDASMLVRIVDADDPSEVYLSDCVFVDADDGTDLCAIGDVPLDVVAPIPNTTVRVQVAIWPNPVGVTGPACPVGAVAFDLLGKPVAVGPDAPALGGEAYFEVGAGPLATVELGCRDLAALDRCAGPEVLVRATVDEFDTGLPVSAAVASGLEVAVGEPRFDNAAGRWVLTAGDTEPLVPRLASPPPTWEAEVVPDWESVVCVETLDRGILASPAVRCAAAPPPPIDRPVLLGGQFLASQTLVTIGGAVGGLPGAGLVVGRVVDERGEPLAGATVLASDGDPSTLDDGAVLYLSPDLRAVVTTGATTSSGAFVSLDARFDVAWSALAADGTTGADELVPGGRIEDKVTVVVLRIDSTVVDP
jgi:hypothetical protein